MRNVIVSIFVTLDGVTEAPETWSLKYWNDDIAKFKHDELFSADALLLGRVTYEGFAASWPKRKGDPFTDRMNGIRKYVVSTTLTNPDWNNSSHLTGDAAAEVSQLKRETGQDLLIHGSTTLVNALMPHGLIDEYRLLVYPVVLGNGKRLFRDGSTATLRLTETRPYGQNVVLLKYRR
jgi:dihydrofolate reductase